MLMPVIVIVERSPEGGPILSAGETVHLALDGIEFCFGPHGEHTEGPGRLFITTRNLVWLSSVDSARGYSIDYPSISVHAISRDPAAFPRPCLYMQLGDGGSDQEFSEARLVPPAGQEAVLEQMFRALSECSALNPDPVDPLTAADSEDEEDEDGENGISMDLESSPSPSPPPPAPSSEVMQD